MSLTVTGPGWLLVCSDGLWNYVSEATALQALVAELSGGDTDPLPLSEALVRWANEQGRQGQHLRGSGPAVTSNVSPELRKER